MQVEKEYLLYLIHIFAYHILFSFFLSFKFFFPFLVSF